MVVQWWYGVGYEDLQTSLQNVWRSHETVRQWHHTEASAFLCMQRWSTVCLPWWQFTTYLSRMATVFLYQKQSYYGHLWAPTSSPRCRIGHLQKTSTSPTHGSERNGPSGRGYSQMTIRRTCVIRTMTCRINERFVNPGHTCSVHLQSAYMVTWWRSWYVKSSIVSGKQH